MTWNPKWYEISITLNLKLQEISNEMKSEMTWYLKWHLIPNDMKSQKDMKSQMTWKFKWHEISNDIEAQMTLNLK